MKRWRVDGEAYETEVRRESSGWVVSRSRADSEGRWSRVATGELLGGGWSGLCRAGSARQWGAMASHVCIGRGEATVLRSSGDCWTGQRRQRCDEGDGCLTASPVELDLGGLRGWSPAGSHSRQSAVEATVGSAQSHRAQPKPRSALWLSLCGAHGHTDTHVVMGRQGAVSVTAVRWLRFADP